MSVLTTSAASLRSGLLGAGVLVLIAFSDPPPFAPPGAVPGGGRWLQRQIDRAQPGDVIELTPGATYVGHFVLPAHHGRQGPPVVIRTGGAQVPRAGVRVGPIDSAAFARLSSPDRGPALRALAGSAGWRIERVAILPNREGRGDIVALGSPRQSRDDVPSDLVLDRVHIAGDPLFGQRRAVALNSRRTAILNSYIAGVGARRHDSQAIAGWNGPGEYLIANNYLEAAGENLLFGGADPSIPGLVPTTIDVIGNHLSKPQAWRERETWLVKNLFELKNARDLRFEGNLLERNWAHGQSGYSVLLTVRNQDGECPWCEVTDVRLERNTIKDVAAAISITGVDNNHPSGRTARIVIRGNRVIGLDSARWGGDGFFLQLLDGPSDVLVDRNVVVQGRSGGIIKIEGRAQGFQFTNNVTGHGAYGIIATDHAPGHDSIAATLPGAKVSGNVIAGGLARLYPSGNLFPPLEALQERFEAIGTNGRIDRDPLANLR
jgi:hypothetical protein